MREDASVVSFSVQAEETDRDKQKGGREEAGINKNKEWKGRGGAAAAVAEEGGGARSSEAIL